MKHEVLKNALLNGFYDPSYLGHGLVGPRLVTNDSQDKIWLHLRQQLLACRSFTWITAFVTADMLPPLKLVLADLARQNISGTLITGDYLGFNQPDVLADLAKISNLEVKIYPGRLHTKAYLFDHQDYQTIMVGSANFTRSAMLENEEWMLQVSGRPSAAAISQVRQTAQNLLQKSQDLTSDWLADYRCRWAESVRLIQVKRSVHQGQNQPTEKIRPNQMQQKALASLRSLVKSGASRGLVVSATGTGKTYLGALAVKDFGAKRFLYLVHREQVARKSRETFKRVIGGPDEDFLLVSGRKGLEGQDTLPPYVFATVQTVSQDDVLDHLDPKTFDYILIDEAHRSAAPSYKKIMAHFKPDFWLGMTATPERTDQQDIYRLFDYHLAYEIRLPEALKADMLTPFHYIGVTDYEQNGATVTETSDLRWLTAPERVKYILRQLDYYGSSGVQPKGLVFCSRQEEARQLAELFTQAGHPAQALTNQNSNTQRQEAVSQLESGRLEYIITVDIFNEGVDIPALNQIIMLRNTQSSIIFLQQLGRGLRKYPGKKFVTVIDFIGNYKNNYLIPLTLNHDRSCRRERALQETKVPELMGLSTINFSQIAEQRILQSITKIKLDSMAALRQAYFDLKERLGRPPLLADFYRQGSVSPLVFARNNNFGNYAEFMAKADKEDGQNKLSRHENQCLTFLTQELLSGKRIHELLLLKILFQKGQCSQADFRQKLKENGVYVNDEVLFSVEKILSLDFFDVKAGKQTRKQNYGGQALIEKEGGSYQLADWLTQSLAAQPDFAQLVRDVIGTGLELAKKYNQEEQFTCYRSYNRKDACRLLNWPLDVSAPMYGYRIEGHDCPIFITYHKQAKKKGRSRSARYQNTLADGQSLRWYTRTPRHLDSPEVQQLLAGVKDGRPQVKLHVFVKRDDSAGKDFYYLGQAQIEPGSVQEEKIGAKQRPAVGMNLRLENPLPPKTYRLLFDD